MKILLRLLVTSLLLSSCSGPYYQALGEKWKREAEQWEAARVSAINSTDWPAETKAKLIEKTLWIGMSPEEAKLSGTASYYTPVNRTVTASGILEQWRLEGSGGGVRGYLYFENGKLTAWQDTSGWLGR